MSENNQDRVIGIEVRNNTLVFVTTKGWFNCKCIKDSYARAVADYSVNLLNRISDLEEYIDVLERDC